MAKRLGELLLEAGAITPQDLEEALAAQAGGEPDRVGEILVARGRLSTSTLAHALCAQSGLPFVELQPVSPEISDLVPLDLQVQNRLAPFAVDRGSVHGQVLHVAVADPSTVAMIEDLSMQLGMAVKVFVASADQIEAAHAAYQGQDPIVWPHPSPGLPTAPVAPIPEAPRKPPSVAPAPKLNIPAAPARPLPRKAPERPRTSPPPPPPPPIVAASTEKKELPPPAPIADALASLSLPDWLSEPQDGSGLRPPDRALQLKLETLFAHGGLPSTEAALATVVALLIRRGLLREHEVLDALGRK
jgi:hypothetical protein